MIFVKHLAQWSIPTLMETITRALIMALAAYILPKNDFGILTLAMLIYSFHPLLQLGVVDGLIIKLPGYFVRNKIEKISQSLGLSLSYALIIITVIIVMAITYSIFQKDYDRTFLLCGIYFLTAIPYQIYNHYLLLNRYTYDLKTTSYARLFNAAMRIFLQAPLTYWYGINGLVIGEVIIYMISASLILYSSKIHIHLNLNLKHLKGFLVFGLPIWILSLLSMLAVTFERTISAYYFDLRIIADVGLLAFFGALFIQANGQILSLFSQYSREFFVKTKDTRSLVGAFFIFVLGTILFYVVSASFFHGILALLVIPEYLPEYMSIINLLPIVYAVFLIRIIIAIFFSLFLILGDRKKLFFGHIVFFIGTLFAILISLTYSNFDLTNLFLSILAGVILEVLFLITICLKWTNHWLMGVCVILTTLISCLLPLFFFILKDNRWYLIGVVNFVLVFAVIIFFLGSNKGPLKNFMSIIKKQF